MFTSLSVDPTTGEMTSFVSKAGVPILSSQKASHICYPFGHGPYAPNFHQGSIRCNNIATENVSFHVTTERGETSFYCREKMHWNMCFRQETYEYHDNELSILGHHMELTKTVGMPKQIPKNFGVIFYLDTGQGGFTLNDESGCEVECGDISHELEGKPVYWPIQTSFLELRHDQGTTRLSLQRGYDILAIVPMGPSSSCLGVAVIHLGQRDGKQDYLQEGDSISADCELRFTPH